MVHTLRWGGLYELVCTSTYQYVQWRTDLYCTWQWVTNIGPSFPCFLLVNLHLLSHTWSAGIRRSKQSLQLRLDSIGKLLELKRICGRCLYSYILVCTSTYQYIIELQEPLKFWNLTSRQYAVVIYSQGTAWVYAKATCLLKGTYWYVPVRTYKNLMYWLVLVRTSTY